MLFTCINKGNFCLCVFFVTKFVKNLSDGMGEKKYIEWFGHIKRIKSEEFVRKCMCVKSYLQIGEEGHLGDERIG